MLANGMLTLLRHPAELDPLRDDPRLVDTAVEEILRYEPPVQFVQRFAMRDIEIGGRTVGAGRSLILLFGAANRDPERFADPQRFDVSRKPNQHLAFGASVHFCIGARLARVIRPGHLQRASPAPGRAGTARRPAAVQAGDESAFAQDPADPHPGTEAG